VLKIIQYVLFSISFLLNLLVIAFLLSDEFNSLNIGWFEIIFSSLFFSMIIFLITIMNIFLLRKISTNFDQKYQKLKATLFLKLQYRYVEYSILFFCILIIVSCVTLLSSTTTTVQDTTTTTVQDTTTTTVQDTTTTTVQDTTTTTLQDTTTTTVQDTTTTTVQDTTTTTVQDTTTTTVQVKSVCEIWEYETNSNQKLMTLVLQDFDNSRLRYTNNEITKNEYKILIAEISEESLRILIKQESLNPNSSNRESHKKYILSFEGFLSTFNLLSNYLDSGVLSNLTDSNYELDLAVNNSKEAVLLKNSC
jgi:hypothetical protein